MLESNLTKSLSSNELILIQRYGSLALSEDVAHDLQEFGSEIIVPNITLLEWMKIYLETCRKGTIKDTSYHQLEILADDFPETLKNKPVKAIAPIELQSYINKFAMNKSKSYVCKMAGLIRSAFAEAVENDICTKNPARKLKTPKVHEYPKHSFTKSETDIILNFARTYNQNIEHNELTKRAGLLIGSAVIVLLWTGLRRGELLGLKWSDIENNQLSVNRAVYLKKGEDGKYHPTVTEHEAKTYTSLRTIPLPPEASEAINRLPRIGVYIFGSETGKLMHPRNFNRAYESFGKNLRTAHPEVRKLCPHECRHTFATLTQKAGGSMRTVQVMLGHARIETTARYTHPDFSAMETVIDEYSKMLGRSAE